LLEELRSATREAHHALDQGLSLNADTITLPRYVAFLQGLWLVVEPLERRLNSAAGARPARASALREDLAALGATPALGPAPRLPALDSRAAALGASYVLEGSALGGAVLAREIGRGLAFERPPLRYLTLYGERLAERWRDETAALDAWGQTATLAERAECCKAARDVFEAFTTALRATSSLPEVA
jgi:heme oxygenase